MPPLMPKASAAWLIDHTSLTFKQIAHYTCLHVLEVQAIADAEISIGQTTYDPIKQGSLSWDEIHRCEKEPCTMLIAIKSDVLDVKHTKKGGKYTPLLRRRDRPHGIAWLLKHHPELSEGQICVLLGTTRKTIHAIKDKTHSQIKNIKAQNPVVLELCTQQELDALIQA